jgi:hypothetical protein
MNMSAPSTDVQETEEVSHEVSLEDAEAFLRENGNERLVGQLATGVVTPIAFAQALGVRPQQVYNYIRNDRLAARKTKDTQKLVISKKDAVAETARILTARARRAAKVESELEGE